MDCKEMLVLLINLHKEGKINFSITMNCISYDKDFVLNLTTNTLFAKSSLFENEEFVANLDDLCNYIGEKYINISFK